MSTVTEGLAMKIGTDIGTTRKRSMKISVITAWGNEHLIAPYFCRHYAFADEVIVLMGPGISDETVAVCDRFQNVTIREVKYPNNKWDMYIKQNAITAMAHEVNADWVIVVDADEFVFPNLYKYGGQRFIPNDPRSFLETVDGNVVMAAMWHVYRNTKDKDLDLSKPPLFQRRYGDPEIEHHYIKPIVVRPKDSQIKWHIGAHRYFDNPHIKVSTKRFHGVHWHWADVDIAIARHYMVAGRIVKPQQWLTDATNENEIRKRCKDHEKDPRLF